MWAVAADAPLERFAGDELQEEMQDVEAISRHALAHAAVVEFFFRRAPVIPLKLFTLFSSDAAARVHVLERRAQLARMFAGVRGMEESGHRKRGRRRSRRPEKAARMWPARRSL
jgi:hypothetical protein